MAFRRAASAKVLILLGVGLLASCASQAPRSAPSKGWTREAPATLVHVRSGQRFPQEWNGMARVAPQNLDDAGDSFTVGYRAARYDLLMTLVATSRSEGDPILKKRFENGVNALIAEHEETRVDEAAAMRLPLGEATVDGFGAFLQWPEGEGLRGAFVVVAPAEERVYEIRAPFDLDDTGGPMEFAWKSILAFLRTLERPTDAPPGGGA